MGVTDIVFLLIAAIAGFAGGLVYQHLKKATVALSVQFPSPSDTDDWKAEDIAGALIMFSEPVVFLGVRWFDRYGDVITSEFIPFRDVLEGGEDARHQ